MRGSGRKPGLLCRTKTRQEGVSSTGKLRKAGALAKPGKEARMKDRRRGSGGWMLTGLAILLGIFPLSVSAQTFTTRIIAHVPRNINSLSLNDNGWAVWTTGL